MSSSADREEVRKWLEAWYDVGDKCVPANSIKWFASDCTVRFNNGDPAHGKKAAQKLFEATVPSIERMSHRILDIDIVGGRIWNECEVVYVAKDDPENVEVHLHRVNLYERVPKGQPEEGGITRWNAFFDPQPFRERLMAAAKARGDDGGGRVY